MSHADAAWLRMDSPTNLMVINTLLWFDETPDWDAVQANHIALIVDRFPRFRRLGRAGTLSGAHWQDVPEFNPAPHFHRVALPAPQDARTLRALVGDLAAAPLSHDRPLWEVYFIEGVGDGAAMLIRIHHSIADGVALARVMLSAMDGDTSGPGIGDGASRGSAAAAMLGAGVTAIRHPRRTATRGMGDLGTLVKLLLPGSESSQALKGNGQVAHRVGWSQPVELWRVKRTARAFGVTVNDVLMAALAGALRAEVGPERLHALVPVNLRRLDEPLPPDLGNRFGLVLATLPSDAEAPLDRLDETHRAMEAIKHSNEGAISFGILDVMGRAPAGAEAWMIDYFTAKASMVVTNVIGPRRRISLTGTPVAGILVWAPASGSMRMSVSLFSYAGKVSVGFLADAGVLEDPQPLADAFRRELLALSRHAQAVPEPTS